MKEKLFTFVMIVCMAFPNIIHAETTMTMPDMSSESMTTQSTQATKTTQMTPPAEGSTELTQENQSLDTQSQQNSFQKFDLNQDLSDQTKNFYNSLDFESMSQGQLGQLTMDNEFMSQFMSGMNGENSNRSFSDMFSEITGRDVSQESMFDTSTFGTDVDVGKVNLQYSALVEGMQTEQKKTDVSGQSQKATSVFKDNYGDLAKKLTVKKAKIPKSFNPDKMLNQASKSIDDTYGDFQKTDSNFKATNGNINVSSIFEKAKNGVTTYSTDSASELQQKANDLSSGAKSDIKSEFDNNRSDTRALLDNLRDDSKGRRERNDERVKKNREENDDYVNDNKLHNKIGNGLNNIKNKTKKGAQNLADEAYDTQHMEEWPPERIKDYNALTDYGYSGQKVITEEYRRKWEGKGISKKIVKERTKEYNALPKKSRNGKDSPGKVVDTSTKEYKKWYKKWMAPNDTSKSKKKK